MIKITVIDSESPWWELAKADPIMGKWFRQPLQTHRKYGWLLYKHTERNQFINAMNRVPGAEHAILVEDLENDLYRLALSSGIWIKVEARMSRFGKLETWNCEYRGEAVIEYRGVRYLASARPAGPARSKGWGDPPELTWPWNFTNLAVAGWIKFYEL
tara:strand:- start:563 stop:1036 length:474 start_codon:yes stop_codon:yes gene_type:complete